MPDRLSNRQWTVAEHPTQGLNLSHFGYKETPVPNIQDGEVLLKTHYLNLAPVMRMYMMADGGGYSTERLLKKGDVIHGRGIGEVIKSKHKDYAIGDFLQGQIGWQSYKVSAVTDQEKFIKMTPRGVPAYYALSALGMTGFSAYVGFIVKGQPQPGEAVLVSGAAGGVGSLVVQMAKAMGCYPVVGIAGGPEKCSLLKDLGADETIDYKAGDIIPAVKKHFPNGINVFFDNVGGTILNDTIPHLAKFGRIISCGAISEYANNGVSQLSNYGEIRHLDADIRGFYVYNHQDKFEKAEEDIAGWIKSGRLKALVDIKDGFENMPEALIGLYQGANKGKSIVRVNSGEDIIY